MDNQRARGALVHGLRHTYATTEYNSRRFRLEALVSKYAVARQNGYRWLCVFQVRPAERCGGVKRR